MAAEVLRVGAVAKLDPEPERELTAWREDLGRGAIDDPEETRARLEAQQRGDWAVARLHLFADLLEGDAVSRRDGEVVSGCWLERGEADQNMRHARELTVEHLEDLWRHLENPGVRVALSDLGSVPVRIELDGELERALG